MRTFMAVTSIFIIMRDWFRRVTNHLQYSIPRCSLHAFPLYIRCILPAADAFYFTISPQLW